MQNSHSAGRFDLCWVLAARRTDDQKSTADQNQIGVRNVVRLTGTGYEPDRDKGPFVQSRLNSVGGKHGYSQEFPLHSMQDHRWPQWPPNACRAMGRS
jgi:hypothetical protein